MFGRLTRNQWLMVLLAVVLVVGGVYYFTREGMQWGPDATGEGMMGVYGSESIPQDYNLAGERVVRDPLRYQVRAHDQEMPISELAARGADRANGYGSSYHIVGEQVYPCSNDPNSLGTYPCGVDDYSVWQDGTKKDFKVNPVYGAGEAGGCRIRYFPHSQNPYNYNETGDCRCSANQNPRQTFTINDNFDHVGRKWTGSNRYLSVGDKP